MSGIPPLKNLEWNQNIENLLKEKQFKCVKYSWLHLRDSQRYNNFHNYIYYINTIFTSLSGASVITSNGLSKSISIETLNFINIIFGVILIFSTVLNAFQHQTNYSELSNKHKIAAAKYSSLGNNMLKLLALDEAEKKTSLEYFTWADTEYTDLEIESPTPSDASFKVYLKENINQNSDDNITIVIEKEIDKEKNNNLHLNETNRRNSADNNTNTKVISEEMETEIQHKNDTKKYLREFRNKRFINNQLI